jgi:hypothetical protein
MTSSAIPARLLFQCGHAALVTLPRVKGENATQRTERVAREKSGALVRQCDFCGPAVQTNGNHLAVADVLAAEPIAMADPVASLDEPVVAFDEPVVFADEPAFVVEEVDPVVDELVSDLLSEEEELALLADVEVPVVIVEEPVVVVEEPVIVVELVEERVRRARRPRRPARQQQRFTVEYLAERTLHAADIRDALRQATALNASELLSIERLD